MAPSATDFRRELQRAMQDDQPLYAELRAQLVRTLSFVLHGRTPHRAA